MSNILTDGLLFPALGLALCGWLVPKLLSLLFPEGVKPLMLLAFVSTLVMFSLSSLFFLALYLMQGVPLEILFEGGALEVVAHFGWLGLLSALFWAPIMVLSVAGLPKNWVDETW